MGEKKLLKFMLIGIACFVGFIIFITAFIQAWNETDTENDKKEEMKIEVKKREVYPTSIIKAIQDLEKSKETKQVRYKLFDEKVSQIIQFKPSDEDLEFYKKFVLSDYKKITFDYVQSLNDAELLKMIYRNRHVDMYYVNREIYDNPLGGVAFNVIQIARDQYEGTLTKKNYEMFKQTMDGHFNNIN